MTFNDLTTKQLADLRSSGLTDETIMASGIRGVKGGEAKKLLNWKSGSPGLSMAIPFMDAKGEPSGYIRLKPDNPRANINDDGKERLIKYESPKGASNRAYFPPVTIPVLNDPSIPILITEGEKKALKADQEGFACIGLVGVYGFCKKRPKDPETGRAIGPFQLIDDLKCVAWENRPVYIVYDSDLCDNENVILAEASLADVLKAKGAIVRLVRLPDSSNGKKVGLDDYLIEHAPEDLRDLIDKAQFPIPILLHREINTIRRSLKKGGPARDEVNRMISETILNWMKNNGRVLTAEGEAYWFYNQTHRLYVVSKDSETWNVLMTTQIGINPADTEYNYVINHIRYQILGNANKADVYLVSFFDRLKSILYMSTFDGNMYRLDGSEIELVNNGTDGVLFLDHPIYQPFRVEFTDNNSHLLNQLIGGINFQKGDYMNLKHNQQMLLFTVWVLSLPFNTILPTKPIVLMMGVKGSGKTSVVRQIQRFLLGSDLDVFIMSKDKEDSFRSATSKHFMTIWDNVDGNIKWLNDYLATASTGGMYSFRKLYTTNEDQQIRARAHVILTARTPHFNRDDVCDRLLVFKLDRIDEFIPESELLNEIDKNRSLLMGEYLLSLNEIVSYLKKGGLKSIKCNFRMADWGRFGMVVCEALNIKGGSQIFQECLNMMVIDQEEFGIGDDSLYQLLHILIERRAHLYKDVNGTIISQPFTAGRLLKHLNEISAEDDVNIEFTYKTSGALSKRILHIKDSLARMLGVELQLSKEHNQNVYRFIQLE